MSQGNARTEETMSFALDRYEKTLSEGLLKICRGEGLLYRFYDCPDVDARWDSYIKDYIADAVENFNQYPEAAIGFAAFLGMGVVHNWDSDWLLHRNDSYKDYYGDRGFDNMDDHIVNDILGLSGEEAAKLVNTLQNCISATLGLIQHEGIETQTALGFYILSRSYKVFYKLGVSLELKRLGYRLVPLHGRGKRS